MQIANIHKRHRALPGPKGQLTPSVIAAIEAQVRILGMDHKYGGAKKLYRWAIEQGLIREDKMLYKSFRDRFRLLRKSERTDLFFRKLVPAKHVLKRKELIARVKFCNKKIKEDDDRKNPKEKFVVDLWTDSSIVSSEFEGGRGKVRV